jgi:hypothetical protein
MKHRAILLAMDLLLVLVLPSCEKNETIIDGGGVNTNVPSYNSVLNEFGYSITARGLTTRHAIPLNFTLNRQHIFAAVFSEVSGSAAFTLLDRSQRVIHADTFRLSGLYQVLSVSGIPDSVVVSYANFTGSVHYVLLGVGNFDSMAVSEFPTSVGSQWTYAVFDSLAQQRDTLVVTVFGQTILPGNIPASIWQLAYRSYTDTLYVKVAGDTVQFYRYPHDQWTLPGYLFPLWLYKSWPSSLMEYTQVVQISRVVTPAGEFPTAYVVEKVWSGFNDSGTLRTWLVPRIGIVKLHRKGVSFGAANVVWELLGYRIVH